MNETTKTNDVVELRLGHILRYGVLGSSGLMVLGLFMAAFQSSRIELLQGNPTLRELLHNVVTHPLDGATLMLLGLVCLMLTPIVRVLTALIGFSTERDWRFVAVSLFVLLMLVGEVIFSSR